MATRKKSSVSDLARATEERGRDAGGVIANQVIDRIVANSTQEFQDFLNRSGNQGSAAANATAAMSQAPTPQVPAAPASPPEMALAEAAMPAADLFAPRVQQPSFMAPPALMPTMPATGMMNQPVLPAAPQLMPNRQTAAGPEMEMLLRSVGLL